MTTLASFEFIVALAGFLTGFVLFFFIGRWLHSIVRHRRHLRNLAEADRLTRPKPDCSAAWAKASKKFDAFDWTGVRMPMPPPKPLGQWHCSKCSNDQTHPAAVFPQCCGVPMQRMGLLEDITPPKKK